MLVYRVQNEIGVGPYRTYRRHPVVQKMFDAHDSSSHPQPKDDGIEDFGEHHLSGFASVRDLRMWFEGFLSALIRHGYSIVIVEVPESAVLYGGEQVMYDRNAVVSQWVVVPSRRKDGNDA